MFKLVKKINKKLTHMRVLIACCITFLVITLLGCIAPYFSHVLRNHIAYATGWSLEFTFIAPLYLIIKDWKLMDRTTKYLLTTGIIFLAMMYLLWLLINYGEYYPDTSAIGFNTATEYLIFGVISLIVKIYSQHRKVTELTKKIKELTKGKKKCSR